MTRQYSGLAQPESAHHGVKSGVEKGLDAVTPTSAKTCLLTSGFLHKWSLTTSCLKDWRFELKTLDGQLHRI